MARDARQLAVRRGGVKKPILHMTEDDPEKVRQAGEVMEIAFEKLAEISAELHQLMLDRKGFTVNLYDEDVGRTDAVIKKYTPDATVEGIILFTHPEVGPCEVVVFRLRPGVDMRSMMRRQTGVDMPEHPVN